MKTIKKSAVCVCLAIFIMLFAGCRVGSEAYYKMRVNEYNRDNKHAQDGAIVFLGDSLTEMCKLQNFYPTKEYTMYNRGISGDTVEGVSKRLESNVFAISPKQIVLLIGINDLLQNRTADYVIDGLSGIIAAIKQSLPDCNLILQSLYPVHDKIEKYSKHTPAILQVNNWLAGSAADIGYRFLNIFEIIKQNGADLLNERYSSDGLHLNKKGYSVVAPVIMAALTDFLQA